MTGARCAENIILTDHFDSANQVTIDDDVSEEEREKFHCSQCTKSYLHKSHLLRHMKKHHDTFSCDICSQSFFKLAQLK